MKIREPNGEARWIEKPPIPWECPVPEFSDIPALHLIYGDATHCYNCGAKILTTGHRSRSMGGVPYRHLDPF